MKLQLICFLIIGISLTESKARRRGSTTTTTTEAPSLEETLADREAALLEREESFRKREAVFREREETLSQREDNFKQREEKLSKREANIALREQNTLKGKCSSTSAAEQIDTSVQRHDVDTGKVADIGDISICSDNMRFFALKENETLGKCDCDHHVCSRPLIWSDKYKTCFWAWSQGPCEQNEWFRLNEDMTEAVCEVNPCPASPSVGTPSYYFLNPTDSKCYKAGSKGPCTKRNERLHKIPTEFVPKCRSESICPPQSIPAVQRCIPGNRRWFEGLCGEDSASVDDEIEE